MPFPPSPALRIARVLAVAGAVFMIVLIARLWSGGYLDRDPIVHYPGRGTRASVEVLYFSGDAGMRFGMGPYLVPVLSAHGIETTAIAMSTAFRLGKDRHQLDSFVSGAVAAAERHADGRRLIVIAQSYGADIAQTGLAALPVALRKQIAGVILIVPGTGTFYRADPLGLSYELTPDSRSIETVSRMDWTPLTCIYGREEDDSLCPLLLSMDNARAVALPGGHYLKHDKALLAATVMRAVARTERGR